MSPDVRVIPASGIDASRVESFPYPIAEILPDIEDVLPEADTEVPLGEPYSETPEEQQLRIESVDQVIFRKFEEADRQVEKKHAAAEQKIAEVEQRVAEAEQKIVEAEQKVEEIRQQAFEEGYVQGQEEGRISAEDQFKVHLGRLEESFVAISNSVSLLKAASEDEVLALITVIAEYLAAQHLGSTAEAAGPLWRNILKEHPLPLPESAAPGEPAAVLFMHSKDIEQIQTTIANDYPGLRVLADNGLSRGSIRLETADTVIDASFERRRERLLHLVNRLKEEGQI